MDKIRIFVSSVQELAEDRRAIKEFIQSDPLLSRFFRVFLFEDLPAADRRADALYLEEVDGCEIYIGLFGSKYGFEDAQGLSPTEREFNRATDDCKSRLIFVKDGENAGRHAKMEALIKRAGAQLIRRRYNSVEDLKAAIYASLVDYLESRGIVQDRPFEERPCRGATINDLNIGALRSFIGIARQERQFPLSVKAPVSEILTHLHLVHSGEPTNAALLLFGRDPQRFLPNAEIRCMHFHGTEIQRPVPFYRIFKGTTFEQVDMTVDFVMSKLDRSVGTRAESIQAPVRYEIPHDVIREAVVNAVAHRDYTSPGSVQVSVFADRVEVWNPGNLPPSLTAESLRHPHGSVPRNHRICEVLFLARYVEKYGTGTLMMIRECLAHDLPEPAFAQRGGEFTTVLWRDWLTPEVLSLYALNGRQRNAVAFLKRHGRITNSDYQKEFSVAKRTASLDLGGLLAVGLIEKAGSTGKGVYYLLAKGASKGQKGP